MKPPSKRRRRAGGGGELKPPGAPQVSALPLLLLGEEKDSTFEVRRLKQKLPRNPLLLLERRVRSLESMREEEGGSGDLYDVSLLEVERQKILASLLMHETLMVQGGYSLPPTTEKILESPSVIETCRSALANQSSSIPLNYHERPLTEIATLQTAKLEIASLMTGGARMNAVGREFFTEADRTNAQQSQNLILKVASDCQILNEFFPTTPRTFISREVKITEDDEKDLHLVESPSPPAPSPPAVVQDESFPVRTMSPPLRAKPADSGVTLIRKKKARESGIKRSQIQKTQQPHGGDTRPHSHPNRVPTAASWPPPSLPPSFPFSPSSLFPPPLPFYYSAMDQTEGVPFLPPPFLPPGGHPLPPFSYFPAESRPVPPFFPYLPPAYISDHRPPCREESRERR